MICSREWSRVRFGRDPITAGGHQAGGEPIVAATAGIAACVVTAQVIEHARVFVYRLTREPPAFTNIVGAVDARPCLQSANQSQSRIVAKVRPAWYILLSLS